ncbi:hypothetical protein JYQ62_11985 [Nostoc sp. UHCC 0702]|nr:hypothetical protein JYQ62_11985 [Nostoc sp. UHCC 0702]
MATITKPAIAPMFAPTASSSWESTFFAEPVVSEQIVSEQPQLQVSKDTELLSKNEPQPDIASPAENLPLPTKPALLTPLVMQETMPLQASMQTENPIQQEVKQMPVQPLPPTFHTSPPTHSTSVPTNADVQLEESFPVLQPEPEIVAQPQIQATATQLPAKITTKPIIAPVLVSLQAQEIAQRSPQPEILATERPEPAPTIRIHINRVEVRAVNTQPRSTPAPPSRPAPRLSLDDYLRKRNGG